MGRHLYERGLTWNVLEAREVELAVLFFFRLTFLAASRWASMASSLLNISRILDRQLQFTFTVGVQTVSIITFLLCSKIEFDADAARRPLRSVFFIYLWLESACNIKIIPSCRRFGQELYYLLCLYC